MPNPADASRAVAVLRSSFLLATALAAPAWGQLAWGQSVELPALPSNASYRVPEVHAFERPLSHARAWGVARDALRRAAPFRPALQGGEGTASERILLSEGIEADMPIALALTPDGATLVVVARDTHSLELHDAATGARLASVPTGRRPVDVALTADGKRALVACVEDDTLRVIELATRRELASIDMPFASPFRVEITPDGTQAVVAMVDRGDVGGLALVDLASYAIVRTRATPGLAPLAAQFAPGYGTYALDYADVEVSADGSTLAVGDFFGGFVRLFDTATLEPRTALDTRPFYPSHLDLSDSGTTGVVSLYGAFRVPDAVGCFDITGSALRSFPVSFGPLFNAEVRITPDDTRALVGTYGGSELIDLATGAITPLDAGHALGGIEFSRDGSRAILGGFGTKIVDLATEAVVARISEFLLRPLVVDTTGERAFGVSFLLDEDLRALSTDPARVLSQDPVSAGLLWRRPIGEPVELDGPYFVDATADGSRAIVTCAISHNLALVDLDTSEIVATVPTAGPAHAVAASPVEDLALVMQVEDGSIAVLDTSEGRMLTEVPVSGEPSRVQISPDGRRGFVMSREGDHGIVSVLDVRGANTSLAGEVRVQGSLWSMAHSPDGSLVAVGGLLPGSVTLIDADTSTQIDEVSVALFPQQLAFTPDGSRLLATSTDRVLTVLELQGGSVFEVALPDPALTLNVGPGGRHAYVVAPDSEGTRLVALDLESYEVVASVPITVSPSALVSFYPFLTEVHGNELFLAQTEIETLWRFRLAGPDTELLELHPIGSRSYGFSYSPSRRTALIPLSTQGDELELVRFGPLPSSAKGASGAASPIRIR